MLKLIQASKKAEVVVIDIPPNMESTQNSGYETKGGQG